MWDVLFESVEITLLVFIFMLLVELTELRLGHLLHKRLTAHPSIQYVSGALLGLVPTCSNAVVVVTMYMSGIVSFGALVSVMITTLGEDGLFLYAGLFIPSMGIRVGQIVALALILFVVALAGAALADYLLRRFPMSLSAKCVIPHHHDEYHDRKFSWRHFLTEHAFRHVFRKHIPPLFLWMFGTLLAFHLMESRLHLSQLLQGTPAVMILLAALVGLLPFSGPHVVFITLFSQGAIPFSVLVTNSIIQDGHGLLPLLSFSVTDGIKIKLFKLLLGLAVGYGLLLAGI